MQNKWKQGRTSICIICMQEVAKNILFKQRRVLGGTYMGTSSLLWWKIRERQTRQTDRKNAERTRFLGHNDCTEPRKVELFHQMPQERHKWGTTGGRWPRCLRLLGHRHIAWSSNTRLWGMRTFRSYSLLPCTYWHSGLHCRSQCNGDSVPGTTGPFFVLLWTLKARNRNWSMNEEQ